MPFISQKTIDEIQNRLDPVGIIGEYVRLQQRGDNFWGLCPFHHEKTPSFSVNTGRKSYYCFGCNEGGSVINFVMNIEKISFPETLAFLAKKLGVQIQYEQSGDARNERDEAAARKQDDLLELCRRVAGSFHYILMEREEGQSAKEYLMRRGINEETMTHFSLGYAPSDRHWLYRFLKTKGYSPEFLAQSALFSKQYPESAFFSDRLIFPINNRQGKPCAFGGRLLHGDGPKYLNSTETPVYHKRETLYALDRALPEIRRTKQVYLCEGYMDVIALHQAGVTNTVAPLGTAFTNEQAGLLRRWAEQVNLLFDTDAAGEAACEKAMLTCAKNALHSVVVDMNGQETNKQLESISFKDPADILKEAGAEVLYQSVKNVIINEDYLTAKSKKRFLTAQEGTQGIAKAIAFLLPYFQSIQTEAEKEAFAQRAAVTFGVEPGTLLHDLKFGQEKGQTERQIDRRQTEGKTGQRTIMMSDELYLLTAIAVNCEAHPELFIALRKKLPNEEFENQDAKELYIALEECLRSNVLYLDALLSHIEDAALRDFIAKRSASSEFSYRSQEIVNKGIRGVQKKHLERKSRKLDSEIRLAKSSERDTGDLLLEKQSIIDELQALQEVDYGN